MTSTSASGSIWSRRQRQKRRKKRRARIHSKGMKHEIETFGCPCTSANSVELSSVTGPDTEHCEGIHSEWTGFGDEGDASHLLCLKSLRVAKSVLGET
jgi:hypothetical protein